MTPCSILIVGTGGQGVFTTARILCNFFLRKGQEVVSGQLHGMAQRGGSVQATVIASHGISPVIPRGGAHIVLGLEPVETVRALEMMSPETQVFMNTAPVLPYVLSQRHVLEQGKDSYPEMTLLMDAVTAVTPNLHTHDATELAHQAGSLRTLGVVMLGWWLGSGEGAANREAFMENVLCTAAPAAREANKKAFSSGIQVGRSMPYTKVLT